jgi:hypothetical protein
MRARHRHLNQRDAGGVLILDSRRISGLSDGNSVSQWDDASRNGWNVTQSTAALRPIYKTAIQGGNPVVRFDGANAANAGDRLISSSVSVSQTFYALCLFQVSSSDTNGAVIFDSVTQATSCTFYTGTATDIPNNFGLFAGTSPAKAIASRNNNWNVASVQFSGSTSFGIFNGGAKTTVSATIGSNALSGISIGNLRGSTQAFVQDYSLNGDIATIVIVASSVPDALRKRLEHAAAYSFKISCN